MGERFPLHQLKTLWLFSIRCTHLRGLVRDLGGEAGDRPPLSRVEENVVREHGSGGGGQKAGFLLRPPPPRHQHQPAQIHLRSGLRSRQ